MSPKKKKYIHVVPAKSGDGWTVKKKGTEKASRSGRIKESGKTRRDKKIYTTQKEAISVARDIAKSERGQLVIHGRSGKIRERDSYGKNPYPKKPRDVIYPAGKTRTKKTLISSAVENAVSKKDGGKTSK